MLVPVFMLFIWCANAYTPRCTNISSDTPMTFKPTKDDIKGRYRAEFCTRRDPNVTKWEIDLLYYDSSHYSNCDSNWPKGKRHHWFHNHQHSIATVQIEDTNNCTHVCYSMDMDLIFNSCYLIKSTMFIEETRMPPNDSYHMITNELTMDSLMDNKPYAGFTNNENGVSLIWFLGVPPTQYKVTLCQTKDATGADIPKGCTGELELDVTRNCTSDERHKQLACELALPCGRYSALVELAAPWTVGAFSRLKFTRYYFTHAAPQRARVRARGARGAAWWGWAGGAALLLGAAALAAAARRALRRCRYTKPAPWPAQGAHQRFGDSEPSTPAPDAGVSDGGSRAVLVLYAREGERGARLAERLLQLVRAAGAAPVLDLYSPAVLAAAARAPHDWLRAALAARGTRVLLLQTPALAALYQTHLTDTDAKLKLVEPLLGRRVVYREPQFADSLLQYALRLMMLDAHNHHAYHKYYLATLTDLPTEIVPQLVPFRRYPLPHAAATLLRDLAPPAAAAAAPDPAPALQQLAAAADQFTTHAAEHPTYLMDELLVINNV